MRFTRMLGLAAVAALAVVALGGVGSAAGDSLCEKAVEHKQECPVADRVANGASIAGLLVAGTESSILAPKGTTLVKCKKSSLLGKFEKSEGPHKGFWALITALLFTECTGCEKAHGFNFPYLLLGLAEKLHALVTKHVGAAGPMAWELNNCLGQNCKFQIDPEPALFLFKEDLLIADEIPIKQTTKCVFSPEKAFWDASYLVTLDPAGAHTPPVYIALTP